MTWHSQHRQRLYAPVCSGVTWLLVLRSQNTEMPNITQRHGHVHIHPAHISSHRRVKQTGTRKELSPLNVSARSDLYVSPFLFSKWKPCPDKAFTHTLNMERLLQLSAFIFGLRQKFDKNNGGHSSGFTLQAHNDSKYINIACVSSSIHPLIQPFIHPTIHPSIICNNPHFLNLELDHLMLERPLWWPKISYVQFYYSPFLLAPKFPNIF